MVSDGVQVVRPVVAVPDLAQTDDARHVLQFAVTVGGAGQTVEWVVGDVELHDALAELGDLGCLGANDHAVGHRGGAGSGCATAAVDFDQTESAGAERLEPVGGAQLRDVDARQRRGAHDRRALGHGDREAVHLHGDGRRPVLRWRAVVGFLEQAHRVPSVLVPGRGIGLGGEVLAEVGERTADGHGGEPTHRAQRTLGHDVAEVFEQGEILVAVLTGGDPIDHFHTSHRADPAWRALATRLRGAELHGEPGLRRHVDGLVEHHDAPVTDHGPGRGECLVVHRQAEVGSRQIRAERATDLDRAHRTAGMCSAAIAVDEFAQRHPERHLDDATAPDVPAELEQLCATRPFDAKLLIRPRPVGEDGRHAGQRQHVVDHRRLAEQPVDRRESAASRGPCRACPRGSPASRFPRRRCRRRRPP